MTSTILAFSGSINSGKTTLSQEIASKLDWKKTSFGDYVRSIAEQKRVKQSRENLQQLGEEEIESDCQNFCNNVLSFANWEKGENLIIDGIRHEEVLDNLKTITSPSNVYLIYIHLDLKNRKQRSQNSESVLKKYDSHSTERQVSSILPTIADLVIDGNKKIEEIVSEIIEWVNFKQDLICNRRKDSYRRSISGG